MAAIAFALGWTRADLLELDGTELLATWEVAEPYWKARLRRTA